MKQIYVAALLFYFSWFTAHSQSLDWRYDSPGAGQGGVEQGFAVKQTADNGYIIAGRTGPLGLNVGDIYILKLNSAGAFQWSKTYAGNYIDEARAICQQHDGTYIYAGVTIDYPDTSIGTGNLQDMLVAKLDANGDTVWVRHFGGPNSDTGDGMDTTGDGGCLVVGRYGVAGSNNDFYLVKVDGNGNIVWSKTYGGAAADIARSVKHTADGGFIIAGNTRSYGPNANTGNIWLMKTNATGDTVWTKVIGGTDEEECYSVAPTADGGYILTGRTGALLNGASDIYVVKTNSTGDVQWTQTYGSATNDLGRGIIQTTDGGYALTGYHAVSTGFESPLMYILKTDNQGNAQWDTLIGNDNSPNGAKGYALQQTSDGGLVVVGENDLGSGTVDNRALVVKVKGGLITGVAPQATVVTSVYPNPFADVLTISIAGNAEKPELDIYNANGQLVLTRAINNGTITINNNELPKGIYFYHLAGKNGEILNRGKIIAQ